MRSTKDPVYNNYFTYRIGGQNITINRKEEKMILKKSSETKFSELGIQYFG